MSIKSEVAKSKEKIVFWDNYKGLLIILVVFAHFTWEYYNCAGILKIITKTIYLFHMPMFIFVSGYLSKSEKSKSLKSINKLLLYYIIFNFLMMIFLATFLNEEINFIKTYNSYWYLFVLVIMRLTITKISKIKYIIPISIIIALLSGYYSWEMTVISKTMALYPFFLLGYNFNTNKFKDIINKSSFKKIIIGLFYLMIFLLLLYIVLKEIVLTKQVLYFGKYKTDFDLIRRLAMFIISFFGIYTSLYLIPNKKYLL